MLQKVLLEIIAMAVTTALWYMMIKGNGHDGSDRNR